MPPPTKRIARRTPPGVYRRDRVAEGLIRIGGGAVLVTVLGICVYLVAVVVPLFQGGQLGRTDTMPLPSGAPVVGIQADEYGRGILVLHASGVLSAVHVPGGEPLGSRPLAEGRTPSAISPWARAGALAIGHPDGTLQTGAVRFRSTLRDVAPEERDIPVGQSRPGPAPDSSGFRPILERINPQQIRVTTPAIELTDPLPLDTGEGPVVAIDFFADDRRQNVVALQESGPASYALLRTTRPLGAGAPRTTLTVYPFEIESESGPPRWLLVSGDGAHVYAVWPDGTCHRYAAQEPRTRPIALAETRRLSESPLTAVTKLIGGQTLLVGDQDGSVGAWFAAPDPTSPAPDRQRLVRAHSVLGPGGPVSYIGTSWRDRSVVVADRLGAAAVLHVASEKRVVRLEMPGSAGAVAAAISPKNDAIAVAHAGGELAYARYEPGFPEITLKNLFLPVHYEGQPAPSFSYQSSAGDDAAEPKLSLTPLIFGTLKATVVAMLFACPLAVLAAIYTSEFLSPGVRRSVKPAIELMASLPSVVLGFVAAMVVAPIVRDLLPGIMTSMVTVPLTIIFAAGLWNLVPNRWRSKVGRRTQFALVGASMLAGFAVAALAGPHLERALFRPTHADLLVMGGAHEPVEADRAPAWVGARDSMSPDEERRLRREGLYFREGRVVRPVEPAPDELERLMATLAEQGRDAPGIQRWLNGEIGGPWPGWLVATIPLTAVFALVLTHRGATIARRAFSPDQPGPEAAIALGQPVAMLAITCALAAALASLLTAAGFDARDSVFGPFTPRNSLVVGVIMGFAIIPIIYSISEDALASVPNSLRAASLGAGASPWQTALRVVVPVAASGIFSASMIGLGRAVGETMIVLMATGNTPTMTLNIFEGFRTLSANIAVELPEAPKGESLYRVLFLCGLVLFIMTFVINTTAEIVRQHFRRKNALL
jgi:phosphate transport system permease protein